jgi:luciferase family oxidoreductase group 1
MRALRRDPMSAESFPQDVVELQAYLAGESIIPGVQAIPGAGTNVPLYILGSSLFGAQLAAQLGLPFAFASHFSPDALFEASALYRRDFRPSATLAQPHFIAGANVVAAHDGSEALAQFHATRRTRVRGMISRGPSTPEYSDTDIDNFLRTPNGAGIANMMKYTAAGTPAEVRDFLTDFAESVNADELIIAHQSPAIAERLVSVELTAKAMAGEFSTAR